MTTFAGRYMPADRLHAVVAQTNLPDRAEGAALFADISGFTPITEKLHQAFGPRQGAEMLAVHLNRVYDSLTEQIGRYGGSIISFAGDAVTCWFGGDDAVQHAAGCGAALLEVMQTAADIIMPDDSVMTLGLKVAIASGPTRRFVVGDPAIQLMDALAGATVARMAVGEGVAERGELVVDENTVARLGEWANVREWREQDRQRFAVLTPLLIPAPTLVPAVADVDEARLQNWLLPVVVQHVQSGLGEYPTELRLAAAVFVRFAGIDYDQDAAAREKLDGFVRLAQQAATRYAGNMLQLTIGDKGSYLHCAFGAPFAHEDDAARALHCALEIRDGAARLGYVDPVQIGISRGMMRTGAYGGQTRRTYDVLGDEVNLSARLMAKAAPGEILLSETVAGARLAGFALEALPPVPVKGKAQPVGLYRLAGRRDQSFEQRFYTTPLVGRDSELAAVEAAMQPARDGRHAGVIYIYGEAGMGKSRLAFEVQRRQQSAGLTWLIGQADSLNRAPFNAFTYFLRPYFRQQREQDFSANRAAFDAVFDDLLTLADAQTQADLTLYRSYLAAVVGLVLPESPYALADDRLRIDNSIAAIKAWVRAEVRRAPLVLHIEDAQWLDATSIRVIQQLTYNLDEAPLALLLTSRYNDDNTPVMIPDIFSVPVAAIDLNRLSADRIGAVVEIMLAGAASARLRRFIHERAEGNPFFTEQLTLDLKERGALLRDGDVWEIQPDVAADVPPNVDAVLIARLDRLMAQVKSVVQTAAVLGREFDVAVLSRMLRDDDRAYIRMAEDEAIWSALDALRYLFRHALLRDAAYAMQVQERLKALHRLAAETIEALYPDDPAQQDALLEHWHMAGDLDRELHYLRLVARRLIELEAQYERAERLLQRALSALAADDARRIIPLNWLSNTSYTLGDYEKAISYADTAQQLAEHYGQHESIAISLNNKGLVYADQGMNAEARACHEQSLAIYRELDGAFGTALNLNNLATIAHVTGDASAAVAYLEQALMMDREMGNRRGIAVWLQNLGNHALYQGLYAEAQAYYTESILAAREIGIRDVVVVCLNNLGNIASDQGQYAEARSFYEQVLEDAGHLNRHRSMAIALGNLGVVAYHLADYGAASNYYAQALTFKEDSGAAFTAYNMGWLARTQLRAGQAEAARDTLREGLIVVNGFIAPLQLHMLVSVCDYQITVQQRWQEAAEYIGLIQAHPAVQAETRDEAGKLLEALRSQLEPALLDAALNRGKERDLDETIAGLVAAFESV